MSIFKSAIKLAAKAYNTYNQKVFFPILDKVVETLSDTQLIQTKQVQMALAGIRARNKFSFEPSELLVGSFCWNYITSYRKYARGNNALIPGSFMDHALKFDTYLLQMMVEYQNLQNELGGN